MSDVLLYIDGNLMDPPDTVIATSYQAADIFNLTARHCNSTNRFKLPKTENNIINLGYSNLEGSLTDVPYRILPAKLISDGIELMPNATAIIQSAGNTFDVELYSGARDFFDLLGDKTLDELTFVTADSYYSGNDGIFDYAYLNTTTGVNEAANPLPDNRKLFLSYQSIIEAIIASNGYTKIGAVFSESRLAAMHLFPLGDRGNYNRRFAEIREFDAYKTAGSIQTITTTFQKISFTDVITNEAGFYNGTDTYTTQYPTGSLGPYFTFQLYARIVVTAEGVPSGGATGIVHRVIINGVNVGGGSRALGFAPWVHELYYPITINGGEGLDCYIEYQTNAGQVDLTFDSTSRFYSVVNQTTFPIYRDALGSMPFDIKQKDFMKDFAVRFGVLFNEDGSTLTCKMYKEILQDKANAKDWTNKREVSESDTKKFVVENKYAQNNYFIYPSENDGTDETTGQGNLTIANLNLPSKKTLYKSVFTNSLTRLFGNDTAGYIKCVSLTWDVGEDLATRLVMTRAKFSYEPTIAGAVSSYRVAYFLDSDLTMDCSFEQFLLEFYPELKESLQKVKLITRKYSLTDIDINAMDVLTLIFDDGHYYLIYKVSNATPSRPTQADILKVI